MPELDAVGRSANPEKMDFEPVVVPIVAYRQDGTEEVLPAKFRAMQPTGAAFDVLRKMRDGKVPVEAVISWLWEAVHPSYREEWQRFLDDPELYLEQGTLIDLYQVLTAYYSDRPTRPPSGSSAGSRRPSQSSRGAARSRASTGGRSRSTED